MKTIKDFTPEEAQHWVDEEFATTLRGGQVDERIESEQRMLEWMYQGPGTRLPDLPNARQAHAELIARLEAHKATQH